jgi:hypothetical protein
LDITAKAQSTKSKISKWGKLKLKSLCITKETINKMKRNLQAGEKFTNHISDKGFTLEICR